MLKLIHYRQNRPCLKKHLQKPSQQAFFRYKMYKPHTKESAYARYPTRTHQRQSTTLNNMATTAHARGDYETALKYLKQSLAIQQEIGDKPDLCATLFNIGHIHVQNDEIGDAISAWLTVYVMAKETGLAQALDALEKLAPQLGLEGGMAAWEALAQRINHKALDYTNKPHYQQEH